MKQLNWILSFLCLAVFLTSCEMSCSVGDKPDEPKGTAEVKDGARIYNAIKLESYKIKLKRAYLEFSDGTRVPEDNFVDFSQPVKLMLEVDTGWVAENNKVFLGASEKIISESGKVIADQEDLFKQYTEGVDVEDARLIYPIASIKLPPNSPPTSFSVQFRVWDKKGEGYIEGSYMLFSK
jgi:hypothetical protein